MCYLKMLSSQKQRVESWFQKKKIMVSWFLELGVGGENGEMLVKFYELSVIKIISPGNLMYMVTVVNSTVQCI